MSNILKISFHKVPPTLDPRKCGDVISSAAIFLLFKGLTRLEPDSRVTYDLADSIHISHDLKTYVFHLGECYWSDGAPITAYDFEKTWKMVLNPTFPALSAHLFFPIKNAEKAKAGEISLDEVGIHAKNAKTLVVELEDPTPYFLELTGFCSLFPVPAHREDQFSSLENFVSSGSFKLGAQENKNEMFFQKNYSCRNIYPVSIEGIHVKILPDEEKAYQLFSAGELDWIGDPISPLPLRYMPSLLESRIIKPVGGVTSCFFNTEKSPFQNLNMRKAFSYAVHRAQILHKMLLPYAHAATGPVPPILKGNKQKIFFQDGNLFLAQECFQKGLAELKGKLSHPITLIFEPSEMSYRIARYLQNDWETAFSIPIQLEALEFKSLYEHLALRQFTIALAKQTAQYSDPMNILERFKFKSNTKNFSGWEDSGYITLLNRCMKATDATHRLDLVEQAETLLMNQMPIAPIYFFHHSYLQKPYLKNLAVSPIGVFHFDRVSFDGKKSRT